MQEGGILESITQLPSPINHSTPPILHRAEGTLRCATSLSVLRPSSLHCVGAWSALRSVGSAVGGGAGIAIEAAVKDSRVAAVVVAEVSAEAVVLLVARGTSAVAPRVLGSVAAA